MSSKTPTLEEFVESYIQNKAKSATKESYENWLIKNGVSAGRIYSDSLRDINADYMRARGEHGANAERLADLGLGASGYSDYLSARAYSEMQKNKAVARRSYADSEMKNAAGYQEYLKKQAEAENQSYQRIVSEITDKGIVDYSVAYSYAVGAGLAENAAVAAAKTASDISRAKLKESIVKTVTSQQLTASQAKEYALQLGLSEDDAEEIAKYAKGANEYVSSGGYTDADYLEDLKKKAKEQRRNK